MSAILADIQPGDEVILPSFTFVSTANAFVLFGATPVFVDIQPDTLNLNPRLIEAAITEKTRAIVPVHYAGVGCDMDRICQIAAQHNLLVIEDDAQGLGSDYKGKPLGTFGDMAAISFHQTKNVTSGGEGGALIINNSRFIERAEIVLEKGTNRKQFFEGLVDKYTWVDLGSSFVLSELNAAFLLAQLERLDEINQRRMDIWNTYHEAFKAVEAQERVRRPIIPEECSHNGHIYYLLTRSSKERNELLKYLGERGVDAVFHYIPLHSAPAGRKFGRAGSALDVTEDLSARLIRLPLWSGLTNAQVEFTIEETLAFFAQP
jgi:dTDP-4-amino-4,6-dideoxygalactose transaminase